MSRPRSLMALAVLSVSLAACGDKPAPATPVAQPTPAPTPTEAGPSAANAGVDPATGLTLVDPKQGAAVNESDEVGRKLMALYPEMSLVSVEPVPGAPLFEIQVAQWKAGTVGYTNKEATYIYVNGDLYLGDGKQMLNYTRQSANDRAYALLQKMPFDKALTFTYGAGARTLVVFEDPDCPLCQQFEEDLKKAGPSLNMTVKILPFPLTQVHPEAEAKSRHLFCTQNPEGAWSEWMTTPAARKNWEAFKAKHPADPTCARAGAVDEVLELAGRLGLNQTPVLLFDNGMTFNGRPTLEELERSFQFIEQAKAQGNGIQPPASSGAASSGAASTSAPPAGATPTSPAPAAPASPAPAR